MILKFCDYGCNRPAIHQMSSGKWCCEKFYSKCPEVKRKNSEKNKNRMTGIFGINHPHYGKKDTEKSKHLKSISKLGNKNPMKNIEVSRKNSLSNKGKLVSIETKYKMSLKKIGNKNPFYRKTHSKESKEKIRKKVKSLYKDENFLKKYQEGVRKKPNKPERILIDLLSTLFPNEYEYTGDSSFWIDGKNPDFTNKVKKKIIELFGGHWHDKEITGKTRDIHEKERIDHFKKNGYSALIIWDNEIENYEYLTRKLLEFQRSEE
jgi:very-short-patch-repair endonuclease